MPTTTKTIPSPPRGCAASSHQATSRTGSSMSDQLSMFELMMSEGLTSIISSPALAAGPMPLKPNNIIQAASADLARRSRNKYRHEMAAQGVEVLGDVEHYAFYAPHVRKAGSEYQLISLAIDKNSQAHKCVKKNTRLIYDDAALLLAALAICQPKGTATERGHHEQHCVSEGTRGAEGEAVSNGDADLPA
jgi:hypothetical protein